MKRMSFLDASFLYSENDHDLHHNAWLGIFAGPAPDGEEFSRLVESKLALIPHYRQRVRFVPHDLGLPVWVDDGHFRLNHHVRHIALPRPGSEDQLRELFTTLMAEPLDRAKPLWVMWTVAGLDGDRWGLISKLHHCMADGATTTDMTTVLLDAAPTAVTSQPEPWTPEPEPTDAQLVEDALREAARYGDQAERGMALLRSLQQQTDDIGRGFAALDSALATSLSIPTLNGPIGPYRRWLWATASLAEIGAVRAALGGTVNDVVLAMVTRAFRDLLLSRGEPVEGRTVRTMVPVSVRAVGEAGGNRVSAMYAELPVGVADPKERLASVRAQMDGLKASKQALAGDVLASLAGFQPPALLALGARLASHNTSPVNTVTTNVPGPQYPLYAVGREMLADYPYITLASNIRIATTVFSYNGVLRFGVTGDYESTPDLDVFRHALGEALAELVDGSQPPAARQEEPASAKGPRKAPAKTAKKTVQRTALSRRTSDTG